jgi:hypothetical protein
VEQLDADARRDVEQLYALSAARSREYQAALARVAALLPAQKAELQHALRELEVRGAKLDYEVRALVAEGQGKGGNIGGQYNRRKASNADIDARFPSRYRPCSFTEVIFFFKRRGKLQPFCSWSAHSNGMLAPFLPSPLSFSLFQLLFLLRFLQDN